jgi:hypothetical protein
MAELPPMGWRPQFNPSPGFSFPEKGTLFTADQQRTRADQARLLFEAIGPICRECGYALARHGSGVRDVDLIAAPWASDAVSAAELVLEIATKLNLTMVAVFRQPHGIKWFCMVSHAFPSLPIELAVCPLAPETGNTQIPEALDDR